MLLWLGLGIPSLIAFCATVPVEQAKSNLAGWLHWIGIDQVPHILETPWTDGIAITLSLVGAGAAILQFVHMTRDLVRMSRDADQMAKDLESVRHTLEGNTRRLKEAVAHGERALDERRRRLAQSGEE